jgi:hypothetical protein
VHALLQQVPSTQMFDAHCAAEVQALPSGRPDAQEPVGVPLHAPALHTSLMVHDWPSSQPPPLSGVTLHDEEPLQPRVLQLSLVQVSAVPPQTPAVQVSLKVQAFPSLQPLPVKSVVWQVPVAKLHVFALQGSLDAGHVTSIEKLLLVGTSFASLHAESPFTLLTQTLKPKVPQLLATGVYVKGQDTVPPALPLGMACITSVLLLLVPLHGKPSAGAQACSPPSAAPSVPPPLPVVPSLCAIKKPPNGLPAPT